MRTRSIRSPLLLGFGLLGVLAPSVRAQACGTEVVLKHLEAGTAAPVLRTPRGAPVIGGNFGFRVEHGAPTVLGVLVYSAFENPIFDPNVAATLWIQPPWSAKFFFTNANGSSPLLFNTSVVTDDLCGVQATFQCFLFDASAPGGLAVSNAARLGVGVVTEPLFHEFETKLIPDPFELAIGHLDQDGVLDVLTLDWSGGLRLHVYLADGMGGLDGHSVWPVTGVTEYAPFDLALAHLDGDNRIDAVVVDPETDSVHVLPGRFPLGFLAPTTYTVVKAPSAVDVGLIDGDLFPDLVLAKSESRFVTVMLGDGAGGFGPPTDFDAGATPGKGSGIFDVELADMDHDGALDAVAVSSFGDLVSVLLGNGDGTFGPPTSYPALEDPRQLRLGDIDGDTHVDVAIRFLGSKDLAVRFGNGDGTLGPEERLVDPFAPSSDKADFALGDMDGQPGAEILVTNDSVENVGILRWSPGGVWERREFPVANEARLIAVGDLDADGDQDVVTVPKFSVGGDWDPIMTVSRGRGDGSLEGPEDFWIGDGALAGDFDGDGNADLVGLTGAPSQVMFRAGNGDGTFGPVIVSVQPPFQPPLPTFLLGFFGAGDLDGDGALDLVAGSYWSDGFYRSLGNGDGTFAAAVFVPMGLSFLSGAFVVDLNTDGVLDVIARTGGIDGGIAIVLGDGSGGFGSPTVLPLVHRTLTVGKIDADADLDLVIGEDTEVLWWPGNGDGTFGAPTVVAQMSDGIEDVVIADVDRDGATDLVVDVNNASVSGSTLLGNGDGTFQAPIPMHSVWPNPTPAGVLVDLDEDGALDVLYLGTEMRRGNGDGTFGPAVVISPISGSPRVVDFDRDGVPDLGLARGGRVTILLNQIGE